MTQDIDGLWSKQVFFKEMSCFSVWLVMKNRPNQLDVFVHGTTTKFDMRGDLLSMHKPTKDKDLFDHVVVVKTSCE